MSEPHILFEDESIIAVDKPVGLAAIPEGVAGRTCLLHQLEAQYERKIYIVHRLDKGVSGVMLFAKTADAHRALNQQFEQRQVSKQYLALAHAPLTRRTGLIDAPLRQFGSGRMGVDAQKGKPSQTRYKVIETFKQFSLLYAHPITGRRHQIRVHLYHLGHPLVGDPRYGDKQLQQIYPRLMLHAESLSFQLMSGETMTVKAPPPAPLDDPAGFVARYTIENLY